MDKLAKVFSRNPQKRMRIYILQIRGTIDTSQTYKVYKALKKFKGNQCKALALVLNSAGGSPSQAYLIMKRFDIIRQKYNVPIYTFAEDYSTNASFLLHQLGDKRFCDETSFIGGLGTTVQYYKAHGLLDKLNIEVRDFSTTDQSFTQMIDPLSKTTSDHEQLQKINTYANNTLIQVFKAFKAAQEYKMDSTETEQLYEGEIFLGDQAKKFGMVHGFQNYKDVLGTDFPNIQFQDLTKKTRRERAFETFQNIKTQLLTTQLSGLFKNTIKWNQ